MIRGALAATTAGIALLAGACSTSQANTNPEMGHTRPPIEAGSSPTWQEHQPGETTRALFDAGEAAVHIIYEPTVTDPEATTTTEDDVDTIASNFERGQVLRLAGRDPSFLRQVTDDITLATDGRFRPSKITVSLTPPVDLDDKCIDNNDPAQRQVIQQSAANNKEPNALNMIVVDENGCDGLGGYNGIDGDPVIVTGALTNLGSVAAHEFGHGAGLMHAGLETCTEPIGQENCKTDPTGDRGSVMSYTNDNGGITINLNSMTAETSRGRSNTGTHFSTPELEEIGLLNKGEILTDPADGEYILSKADGNEDRQSAKVIKLATRHGDLFFSWENDSQAAYDVQCDPVVGPESYSKVPDDRFLYTTSRGGDTNTVICYKANVRLTDHSLQIRRRISDDSTGFVHFNLIARPMRGAPDLFDDPDRNTSNGEVTPGSTLYTDPSVTVKFVGLDSNGSARLLIKRQAAQN